MLFEKVVEKIDLIMPPKMDDSTIDELIKGIQEVNLNLKAINIEGCASTSM